ncbi:response regulator [Endothiovibrio diazotrophicus]
METFDPATDLTGLKVMVVDDSPAIRDHTGRILLDAGCRVTAVADGYHALTAIVDQRPDLILADIAMPRLDGYQLCTLVKNHPLFLDTPVLLLTGGRDLGQRARARGVRADAWLEKPTDRGRLLAAVARHRHAPPEPR